MIQRYRVGDRVKVRSSPIPIPGIILKYRFRTVHGTGIDQYLVNFDTGRHIWYSESKIELWTIRDTISVWIRNFF